MKKGRKKKIGGGEDGLCPSQSFYSSVWFFLFQNKKKDLKKSDTLLGMAIISGSFFCKGLGTGQLILPFQILLSFPPPNPLFVFPSYSRGIENTEMNPFPLFFFFCLLLLFMFQ